MKFRLWQYEDRRLLDNTTWLLLTEMAGKISRILVILALAAHLSAIEYGTVMLALACHEVLKLMLRSGAGTQIIQCSEKNLKEYENETIFSPNSESKAIKVIKGLENSGL